MAQKLRLRLDEMMDALPEAARRYVERLEELVGAAVGLVSTGPDREQTIIRETSALASWFD